MIYDPLREYAAREPFEPRFTCVVENAAAPSGAAHNGTVARNIRLDRYAAEHLNLFSRSQIQARKLRARLNGKEVKNSKLLYGGETLELTWEDPAPIDLIPENIPLEIIYENERIAVINKAQGMVVHPGAGNYSGTLANALLFYRIQKNKDNFTSLGLRPGIVHRLDKDTSGVIITAWDEGAHLFLSGQFKNRKVIKTYAAIVHGCPLEKEGVIDAPIKRSSRNRKLFAVHQGGKQSLTFYKVVKSWKNYSLLLIKPRTGRTHQIRVHLKHIGHPILGDPLYGRPEPGASLMLHAKRLSIILPGEIVKQTFRTRFPERFLEFFRNNS